MNTFYDEANIPVILKLVPSSSRASTKSNWLIARVNPAVKDEIDRFSKPTTFDFASCFDKLVRSA